MSARLTSSLLLASLISYGCAATLPPGASGPMGPAPDVALAPPPAGEGVQLTVGPFTVAAGSEVQRNYFMKLPVDKDVMINRVQVAYPQGSHHCNIFKCDTAFPDHVEDSFGAVDYNTFQMFAASQSGALDWQYPDGVALPLAKQQQLLIQTHWVNASTQKTPSGQGLVKINFWFAKPEAVKERLGMAFIINKNLDIQPHTTTEAKKIVDFARLGYNQDIKVLAATGHFHSRGKSFVVNRFDGTTTGEELYRSENWDEPPFKRYDTPFAVKAGEKLLYDATFVNNSDQVIKFGPHVETEEHSNFFMYFTPAPPDGKAVYDVNGLP